MQKYDYPIIVIGAGAGGLVVAIGAAKARKKVLLIEKGVWGGDCTNFGCVPSKSLIASAHAAHAIRFPSQLGLKVDLADYQGHGALDRVREIVKRIRSHEEPEHLEEIGMATLTGLASFEDPHTLRVQQPDGQIRHVTGKRIVIATGSHPVAPKIEGLDSVPYLTNETVFDLLAVPKKLIVLGGGPIGSELAHAFLRLGSEVTIIQRNVALLVREEPEAQEVILNCFREEGMEVRLSTNTQKVRQEGNEIVVTIEKDSMQTEIRGNQLLVSTGRRPTLDGLNLEAAGIAYTPRGITVDRFGRTAQKHIAVIGDALGPPFFTHLAENRARTVLSNLLLPGLFRKQLDPQPVPRVTYTDPEVAACGMLEKDAIEEYGRRKIATYMLPLSQNDRAITAGATEGFVKVVTKKWSSKILGVTVVAPRAGEMLGELTVAMKFGIPLRKLARLIHPYPTFSLAIRQTADKWLTETLLGALRK